jgi:hypothetical protein
MTSFKTLAVLGLMSLSTMAWHTQAYADGAVKVAKGTTVVTAEGARLGQVYRITEDGSPQIILDGKMVTIPASTLSSPNGTVTTSLHKSEVLALKH